MINDLKSILLKSSEEVDVFIKIFESWRKKLPAISGPVNLYIPTIFKDKYLEVESYFVDKSIWNVHITFHDDKRFVFFTDQFIAEFSPQGLPKQNYSYPKNVFQTFFQLNNVWLVRRFR